MSAVTLDVVVSFVAGLCMGFGGAVVAKQRGRPAWLGFALGLFCNGPGLLWMFLMWDPLPFDGQDPP